MVIRQDGISRVATVLTFGSLVFLVTAPGSVVTISLIIAVILLGALVLGRDYRFDSSEAPDSSQERNKVLTSAGILLVMLLVLSAYVTKIPQYLTQSGLLLAGTPQTTAFGFLIAVAETQFFQGFMANYTITHLGLSGGALASGFLFMVYHFFVYSSNPASLVIVLAFGTAGSYLNWKAGSVSPALISHIINNVI